MGLAPPQGLLGTLLFAQIDHERDALVPLSLKQCGADHDLHPTAVFPKVFLLERFADAGGGKLCQCPFVGRAPSVGRDRDRKSTRLNSSHQIISYAVFCLKKKNNKTKMHTCR